MKDRVEQHCIGCQHTGVIDPSPGVVPGTPCRQWIEQLVLVHIQHDPQTTYAVAIQTEPRGKIEHVGDNQHIKVVCQWLVAPTFVDALHKTHRGTTHTPTPTTGCVHADERHLVATMICIALGDRAV